MPLLNRWFLCFVLGATLVVSGCGPDRPATVPVKGQVTFQGGPPPKAGQLNFAPLEAAPGHILRPASGEFDEQGNVTVTSFTTGDGLVPGRYEVTVECWRVAPTEETLGESYLPKDFPPQEVVVSPSDRSVEVKIDVPAG